MKPLLGGVVGTQRRYVQDLSPALVNPHFASPTKSRILALGVVIPVLTPLTSQQLGKRIMHMP